MLLAGWSPDSSIAAVFDEGEFSMMTSAAEYFFRGLRLRGFAGEAVSPVLDLGQGRPLPRESLAIAVSVGSVFVDDDGDEVEEEDATSIFFSLFTSEFPDLSAEPEDQEPIVFTIAKSRKDFGQVGRELVIPLPALTVRELRRFISLHALVRADIHVTISARLVSGHEVPPPTPAVARVTG